MPLRGSESHSETISAPGQYETLERPLEAVYGPYSTSAPCAAHSTSKHDRSTNEPVAERALSPVSSEPRGCDLNSVNETEITPSTPGFRHGGNRLLPSAGRGEGVRPRTPVRGRTPQWKTRRKSTLWSCQRTLLRPCRPLLLDLLSINKYRPEITPGQPESSPETRS